MRKVKSSKKKINVSRKNLCVLKKLSVSSRLKPRILRRVQILLSAHAGYGFEIIAGIVGVSQRTVTAVISRYRKNGLDSALYDARRPGNPRLLSPAQNERVIALACTKPPAGYSRWTISLLVEAVKSKHIVKSIGRETIRKALVSHDLKPWRHKMWCVKELNDEYIDRMENVLRLYQRGYDCRYPVVCQDEKPIQLLADIRNPLLPIPGHPFKYDYEYKRMGTANLFAAIEPLTGRMILKPTPNRKGPAFAAYIKSLATKYKRAKRIHLVLDNLSTHGINSLVRKFGIKEAKKIWGRFIIHKTPKHGSWLNQAEMAIGLVARQCLGKDRIKNLEELKRRITAYGKHRKKIAIQWKFTVGKARKTFGYYKKKSRG